MCATRCDSAAQRGAGGGARGDAHRWVDTNDIYAVDSIN